MVEPRSIPRRDWREFFDHVSNALLGKKAEIEVAGLDLGVQVVADWTPLIGISYDTINDVLDVALHSTRHLIHHPKEIAVEEDADGISTVNVVDSDGRLQFVRLKEPLMLPAQSAAPAR
jgi:hypothetical protein